MFEIMKKENITNKSSFDTFNRCVKNSLLVSCVKNGT